MGATGALIMALARRRLSFTLLTQAMDTTAKLSTFVVFILVGARVFSLTFYGVNGHVWVEHLLTSLPGGQLGFLIVVNILIFVLAFFLDFFELSFIIIPLIGPVADKLGIDLIWFGVLLASTCRRRSCIRRSASRCSTCAASPRPRTTSTGSPRKTVTRGHDRADLLGRGAVRADPGRHGRPDHHLPADGDGLQGGREEVRPEQDPDHRSRRGRIDATRRQGRHRSSSEQERAEKALEKPSGPRRRAHRPAGAAPAPAKRRRARPKARRPAASRTTPPRRSRRRRRPRSRPAASRALARRRADAREWLARAPHRNDGAPRFLAEARRRSGASLQPCAAATLLLLRDMRSAAIMKLSKRFSATAEPLDLLVAECLPRLVDLLELGVLRRRSRRRPPSSPCSRPP